MVALPRRLDECGRSVLGVPLERNMCILWLPRPRPNSGSCNSSRVLEGCADTVESSDRSSMCELPRAMGQGHDLLPKSSSHSICSRCPSCNYEASERANQTQNWKKSLPDLRDLTRNARTGWRKSKGGVIVDKGVKIEIEIDRYHRTVEKIVRGLFYLKSGTPVPLDYDVRVYPGNEFWDDSGFQIVSAAIA